MLYELILDASTSGKLTYESLIMGCPKLLLVIIRRK